MLAAIIVLLRNFQTHLFTAENKTMPPTIAAPTIRNVDRLDGAQPVQSVPYVGERDDTNGKLQYHAHAVALLLHGGCDPSAQATGVFVWVPGWQSAGLPDAS